MQSCSNVHVYWSSNRVPEVIQSMHRVPIEFPKLRSEIGFRTLHEEPSSINSAGAI